MNINGNLKEKIHHEYVRSVISNHDLVGVCHAGSDQIERVRTHKCIIMPRPHLPSHGGVAWLMKEWLVPYCRVARKHPHLGIMWLRIQPPECAITLYVAVCYFPPRESNYYQDTPHTIHNHFETLKQDIAEFMHCGRVLLCGDFNARTGRSSDIAPACDWSGMEAAGIVVPDACEIGDLMQRLPARYSTDTKCRDNKMGKPLLEMCCDSQVIIMNGRLPGDNDCVKGGEFTYRAKGRDAKSLIDYVIASPDLCFDHLGRVLPGCSLRVMHPDVMAVSTDHAFVSCVVPLPGKGAARTTVSGEPCGQIGTQFRYRDAIKDVYSEIISDDRFVDAWCRVGSEELSVSQSISLFDSTLMEVLEATDAVCKHVRVVHRSVSPKQDNRPRNTWYSEECRQFRTEWKSAAKQHGKTSAQARVACRVYHRATRAARRRHEMEVAADLAAQWRCNPRSFWQTMKGKTQSSPLVDVEVWAQYFAALFKANKQGDVYVSLEEHCKVHGLLYPEASDDDVSRAEGLNRAIQESEVKDVIEKCKRGKAAGVDGVPIEFIAHPVLVPVLTRLFNAVLKRGCYPETWATAAMTPILKSKGNATVHDDYRGIAVGAAMGRLYSIVINNRLDAWAEASTRRAVGQFGFRQKRSTVDAAFVLRHTIEMRRHEGKPLFCAFIDFKKAYDSIDRQLLWKCLAGMGVHGECMGTLRKMYEAATMQVRIGGRISSSFTAEAGVKQGDPLSPLLFGLFIDKVERFFTAELGQEVGVRIADAMCRVLLYADDLVLMADTPEQLQQLLDCLSRFCKACCMNVNTTKSEIVCFNRSCAAQRLPRWVFNGVELPVVAEFRYLGVKFGNNGDHGGVSMAQAHQMVASKNALGAMWNRCYALRIHNVATLCYLYDALVRPVASYGCEVWGPEYIQRDNLGKGEHESMHYMFMRQALKVRATTSHAVMLAELGREPMSYFWVKQCVRLWNKILSCPSDDLVQKCLYENVALATDHGVGDCWAAGILRCMGNLGIIRECTDVWETQQHGERKLIKLECSKVDAALRRSLTEAWQDAETTGSPRSFADNRHQGIKLATYHHWFRVAGGFNKKESFAKFLNHPKDIMMVTHLRMGSHKLAVETGRWSSQRVARSQRVCACCDMEVVEDELHFMLECPWYKVERKVLYAAFGMEGNQEVSDETMRTLMNGKTGDQWHALVNYMKTSYWLRDVKRLIA